MAASPRRARLAHTRSRARAFHASRVDRQSSKTGAYTAVTHGMPAASATDGAAYWWALAPRTTSQPATAASTVAN